MDRSWAVGMEQDDFQREYARKFPMADVIPAVSDYVVGSEPVYHGISGVRPEDFAIEQIDTSKKPEEPKRIQDRGRLSCSGCGKQFSHVIARAGHERKCKAILVVK